MLGNGLLLTALALTLNSWDTVIDPDARRRAFDQLQVGMSRERVESLLGSAGRFRSISGPGSVPVGYQGPPQFMTQECRWEDARETVDIQFRNDEVTKITRTPKDPPDVENLWWSRGGLALIAIFGLVFLLEGLTTRTVSASAPPSA
jgi:hypothetical protein